MQDHIVRKVVYPFEKFTFNLKRCSKIVPSIFNQEFITRGFKNPKLAQI